MSALRTIRVAWIVFLTISLAFIGAHSDPAFAKKAASLRVKSCDTDAVRLAEDVNVLAAPRAGAQQIEQLPTGRFIYLCEKRGEWRGVMYPAEGEHVDCSYRKPSRACARGWIPRDVKTEIYG